MENSTKTTKATATTEVSASFEMKCICLADGSLGTNKKIYSIDDCVAVSCSVSVRTSWNVGEEKNCTLHVSKDGRFYVLEAIDGVSTAKSKSKGSNNKASIRAKIDALRAKKD